MSLLCAGQRASRFAVLQLTRFSRKSSTEAATTPEKQLEEKSRLNSGKIAIQPVRDVMVADVISGAPGASHIISYTLSRIIVHFSGIASPLGSHLPAYPQYNAIWLRKI